MKRIISILIIVITIFCMASIVCVSAAQEELHLSATPFQVRQGEQFSTTIYIPEGANISGMQMSLKYDSEKLTLVAPVACGPDCAFADCDRPKCTYVDYLIDGSVTVNTATPGYIHLNYSRANNINRLTELVELVFLVDDNLASGISDFLTVDMSEPCVAKRVVGGGTQDIDLQYSFDKLSIYEIGDVDMSHIVDIGDAIYVRRHLADLTVLTDFQLQFADTLYDGIVNIGDVIALQRKLAKFDVTGYGDRRTVSFCSSDGTVLLKKSVRIGEDLISIPEPPMLDGYTNGRWSLTADGYTAPDFTNIQNDMTVYALYEETISEYMNDYIAYLDWFVATYNGKIQSDWAMPIRLTYSENEAYYAKVDWFSSDSNVFSNDGKYQEQLYDRPVKLTAKVTSYREDGTKESATTLTYTLTAKGAYSTPTKAEIVQYLQRITNGTISGTSTVVGGEINCDLNLIRMISNEQVGSDSDYEVRIEWAINNNGTYEPISQIERKTVAQTIDLVATITFNGEPLEDDGKVYFDGVSLTAITEDEIRHYIINQIAASVTNQFSSGDSLWDSDNVYGCQIKWVSRNADMLTIEQNIVNVDSSAVNGSSCPIEVQVAYPTENGSNSFTIEYVVSVLNPNNELLLPGQSISESLYYALMEEVRSRFGYTVLTTTALKNDKFVALDLTKYSEPFEDEAGNVHAPITDLTGLAYCENLRMLDISNLNITEGISEIASLYYLETFVANNTGITGEIEGSTPVLNNMINLELVDLSDNDLTTLDMFFSEDNVYGKLKNLYLHNNRLTDIDRLCNIPMLTTLTLSNNCLDSDDISAIANMVNLTYLSLNNNNISDITMLEKLTALEELRLQCNSIEVIDALSGMTSLRKLYLGHNQIAKIDALKPLKDLSILYLNENGKISSVSALKEMEKLEVLNVSGNRIQDLSWIEELVPTDTFGGIREIYAERNRIASFGFAKNLTGLEVLTLADNESENNEAGRINEYLGGLINLKVLTLSGKQLQNLEFLENDLADGGAAIKPLVRLEIANCGLTAFDPVINEDKVSSFVDNIAILSKVNSLTYLDISDNNFSYDLQDWNFATNEKPVTIDELHFLGKLQLLYADNVDIGTNVNKLMQGFTRLQYLSAEHCGIASTDWLSIGESYVYIDLANNEIESFDFASVASSESLSYLYLDTLAEDATLSMTINFANKNMKHLSVEGLRVSNVISLPDMPNLEMLNLANTDLADLNGDVNEDGEYPYALRRFEKLTYLDVSQENVNIFTKANLEMLYNAFNGQEVYLYTDHSLTGFDADREALTVQKLFTQIPNSAEDAAIQIHTFYENPFLLQDNAVGYDLVWSVAQNDWFVVNSNALTVSNWDMRQANMLTISAALDIYTNDGKTNCVSMPVYVMESPYTLVKYYATTTALDDTAFTTETHYFNVPLDADPTDTTMTGYTFDSWCTDMFGNGNVVKQGYVHNVLNGDRTVSDLKVYAKWLYKVIYAPDGDAFSTNAQTTFVSNQGVILTKDAPTKEGFTFGWWYAEDEATRFVEGTVTSDLILYAKWLTNPCVITLRDGDSVYHEAINTEYWNVENTANFYNYKRSHAFCGWYLDAELTQPVPEQYEVKGDVDFYGKWTLITPVVTFDPGDGVVSPETKTVTYEQPYGELPIPTKTGYTYTGWKLGSAEIDKDSQVSTKENHTLKTDWTKNSYIVTFDSNGGTACADKTVTYDEKYGTLPSPTRTGYTFDKWTTPEGVEVKPDDIVRVASNHKLVAQWNKNSYTVSYDLGSPKTTPSKGSGTYQISVTYGEPFSFPVPTAPYYNFVGWYTSSGVQLTDAQGKGLQNWNIAGATTVYAKWAQTQTSYTYIGSVSDFKNISGTGKYMLVQDIDFANVGYTSAIVKSFSGELKGNGKNIRNLNIVLPSSSSIGTNTYYGLFGQLGANANVYDLNVHNATLYMDSQHNGSGWVCAGVIAGSTSGKLTNINVYNCSVTVHRDQSVYGGIVGLVGTGAVVSSCHAYGVHLYGNGDTGGIAGENNGTLNGCTVEKSDSRRVSIKHYAASGGRSVGGICGYNNRGSVLSCHIKNAAFYLDGDLSLCTKIGYVIGHQNAGNLHYVSTTDCTRGYNGTMSGGALWWAYDYSTYYFANCSGQVGRVSESPSIK